MSDSFQLASAEAQRLLNDAAALRDDSSFDRHLARKKIGLSMKIYANRSFSRGILKVSDSFSSVSRREQSPAAVKNFLTIRLPRHSVFEATTVFRFNMNRTCANPTQPSPQSGEGNSFSVVSIPDLRGGPGWGA